MGRVEAEVGNVPVTDPRIVAPAVNEDDDVVRPGREMLFQRVELGDHGLDGGRPHTLRAHLAFHGVAQHRAVIGRVARPHSSGDEGVRFAILLEFEEAEVVVERLAVRRRRPGRCGAAGRSAGASPIADPRDDRALVVARIDPAAIIGRTGSGKPPRPVSARIVQPGRARAAFGDGGVEVAIGVGLRRRQDAVVHEQHAEDEDGCADHSGGDGAQDAHVAAPDRCEPGSSRAGCGAPIGRLLRAHGNDALLKACGNIRLLA